MHHCQPEISVAAQLLGRAFPPHRWPGQLCPGVHAAEKGASAESLVVLGADRAPVPEEMLAVYPHRFVEGKGLCMAVVEAAALFIAPVPSSGHRSSMRR